MTHTFVLWLFSTVFVFLLLSLKTQSANVKYDPNGNRSLADTVPAAMPTEIGMKRPYADFANVRRQKPAYPLRYSSDLSTITAETGFSTPVPSISHVVSAPSSAEHTSNSPNTISIELDEERFDRRATRTKSDIASVTPANGQSSFKVRPIAAPVTDRLRGLPVVNLMSEFSPIQVKSNIAEWTFDRSSASQVFMADGNVEPELSAFSSWTVAAGDNDTTSRIVEMRPDSTGLSEQLYELALLETLPRPKQSRFFPLNDSEFVNEVDNKTMEAFVDDLLRDTDSVDTAASHTTLETEFSEEQNDENATMHSSDKLALDNYFRLLDQMNQKLSGMRQSELDELQQQISQPNLQQWEIWKLQLKKGLMPNFKDCAVNITSAESQTFIGYLLDYHVQGSEWHYEVLSSFIADYFLPRKFYLKLLLAFKTDKANCVERSPLAKLIAHILSLGANNGSQSTLNELIKSFFEMNRESLLTWPGSESLARALFLDTTGATAVDLTRQLICEALAGVFDSSVKHNVNNIVASARDTLKLLVSKSAAETIFETLLIHFACFISIDRLITNEFYLDILRVDQSIQYNRPEFSTPPPQTPPNRGNVLTLEKLDQKYPIGHRNRTEKLRELREYEAAVEKYERNCKNYQMYLRDSRRFEHLEMQLAVLLKHFPKCLDQFPDASNPDYLRSAPQMVLIRNYIYFRHFYAALLMQPSMPGDLKDVTLLPRGIYPEAALYHFFITLNQFIIWSKFLTDLHDQDIFAAKKRIFMDIISCAPLPFDAILHFSTKTRQLALLEAILIFDQDGVQLLSGDFTMLVNYISMLNLKTSFEIAAIFLAHVPCTFETFSKHFNYPKSLKDADQSQFTRTMILIHDMLFLLNNVSETSENVYELDFPVEAYSLLGWELGVSHLLHIVRVIIWKLWKIPLLATAVSEYGFEDEFTLKEALNAANLLLEPYGKKFVNIREDPHKMAVPKSDQR